MTFQKLPKTKTMALRDQPYLPLYVQDFLTDEKLAECSAEANGVYIRIMCLMHKSETYGILELKAKYKQNKSNIFSMYSEMLVRHLPFTSETIEKALKELTENKVIMVDSERIFQKRMVKDGELSTKRAQAGSTGGKNVKNSHTRKLYNEPGYIYLFKEPSEVDTFKIGISKNPDKRLLQISNKTGKKMEMVFVEECENMGILEDNVLNELKENRSGEWVYGLKQDFIISVIKSKTKAKTENEYVIENEVKNNLKVASEKKIQYPTEAEFLEHAKFLIGSEYPSYEFSLKAKFKSWSVEWKDGFGKPIKNWKTKLNNTIPHLGKMKVTPGKIEISTSNDYTAGFPSQTN